MKRRLRTRKEEEAGEAAGRANKLSKQGETQEEKLRALMAKKKAESRILTKTISQQEVDLVRESENSVDMTLEVKKMKEVLEEKEIENRQLRMALRKERIQNYLQRFAGKTSTPLLTQGDKVLHLFPDVLKIIIKKERNETNENLRPLLTTCRRVCRSWKESVDHILQQDSSHLDIGSRNRFRFHYTPFPLQIHYTDEFDDTRWIPKLQLISSVLQRNPSYNPIPSRHLVISSMPDVDFDSENWNSYSKTVKGFLRLVGEQVWYLTVRFIGSTNRNDNFQNRMAVYKCLSEWFSLIPNLRSLALYTWISLVRPDTWNEQLGKMIFPEFKDLVTFEGYLDTHLNYTILSNNRHIKHLGLCCRSTRNSVPSPVVMEIDFPSLSTFNCEFYDAADWVTFVNVTTWELEDLSVRFYGPAAARPTAKQFAEGVAKFRRTLKSLTFDLSEIQKVATGEKLELNLPHLKRLYLESTEWEELALEPLLVSLTSLETFSLELSSIVTVFPATLQCRPYRHAPFLDLVNNFRDKVDWMKLPQMENVKLTVKDIVEIGKRYAFVMRRENMPSVRFNLVKIHEQM